MFFVLRWCVARQSSAEADGGYDEVLHGFLGRLSNPRPDILFLGGKSRI